MTRFMAYRIWKTYLSKGLFLSPLIEKELSHSEKDARERAFLFELLYGTCRQRGFIENILKRYIKRKRLRSYSLLSLGVYQILFMRSVSDYAAVHETVAIAKTAGLRHEAGFINAVLRKVAAEKKSLLIPLTEEQKNNPENIALRLSYPLWIVKKFFQQYGASRSLRILNALNRPAPVLLHSADSLNSGGEKVRGSDLSFGFFSEGKHFVMSPVQKKAVMSLDVQPGQNVLDLCSSPGGKAGMIIGQLKRKGQIICVEKKLEKLLRQNQQQKKYPLAVCVCADAADAHKIFPHESFDKVMLDVPCSNTGEMSKRPEVRWRLRPGDEERLFCLQRGMLESASRVLRPGGELVYATCSLFQEENEHVVHEWAEKNPHFTLVHEETTLPISQKPFGGYHAIIKRNNG